jgi:hypothetical protein
VTQIGITRIFILPDEQRDTRMTFENEILTIFMFKHAFF